MAYYTILNFEDPHAASAAGKVKGGSDPAALGAQGAALGTTQIYARRANARSTFMNGKKMKFYPCQELIQRDQNQTLSKAEVNAIRADCLKSKTIVFVMHGKPDDTDAGFSTSGNQVCTYGQLGNLAKLLLPPRSETYHISLIMCYGARSASVRLNHDGMIAAGELKTSFAYKFFRELCVARDLKLSAWTGAVSNDGDLLHTCENEEQVLYVDDKKTVAQGQNSPQKNALEIQKQALLAQENISNDVFGQSLMKFANSPNLVPVGNIEIFAKQYLPYSPMRMMHLMKLHDTRGQLSKYGKFTYAFSGSQLTIISRYATTDHGPDAVLYQGPLI